MNYLKIKKQILDRECKFAIGQLVKIKKQFSLNAEVHGIIVSESPLVWRIPIYNVFSNGKIEKIYEDELQKI
jgi:hypothetical protein